MKIINIIIVFILLTSCATSDARDWYRCGVSFEKQSWRICSTERDGEARNLKGFCYIDLECKDRFIGKPKKRPFPMFCSFQDLSCVQKMRDSGKKLIKKR